VVIEALEAVILSEAQNLHLSLLLPPNPCTSDLRVSILFSNLCNVLHTYLGRRKYRADKKAVISIFVWRSTCSNCRQRLDFIVERQT
jgi:hypothetical protein